MIDILRVLGELLDPERVYYNIIGVKENTLNFRQQDNTSQKYKDLLERNLSQEESIREWVFITDKLSRYHDHYYNRILGFMTGWGLVLSIASLLSIIFPILALIPICVAILSIGSYHKDNIKDWMLYVWRYRPSVYNIIYGKRISLLK